VRKGFTLKSNRLVERSSEKLSRFKQSTVHRPGFNANDYGAIILTDLELLGTCSLQLMDR
jgi:hypothetical protein